MNPTPFMLDASMLVEFQTCRRKFLLSRKYRPLRWKPKLLFDSCLRQAILDLGNGVSAVDAAMSATTRFMNTGANPGLDISGVAPFQVASDFCAMLETIIHTLARRAPLQLKPVVSRPFNDSLEWVFLAHQDSLGELHRVVTVDRFDDDRLSQELHSWYVFGDVCMSRKPMHLHFIEIGQMREGRRHSPWARAWEHSAIHGRIKFQRKGNKALQGEAWKPVFLADSNVHTASTWVDAMEADSVAESLFHEVEVTVPSAEHVKTFLRDAKTEAAQMKMWLEKVSDPMVVPMSRGACDVPFACAFQVVCYNPVFDVDVLSLGLYKPR